MIDCLCRAKAEYVGKGQFLLLNVLDSEENIAKCTAFFFFLSLSLPVFPCPFSCNFISLHNVTSTYKVSNLLSSVRVSLMWVLATRGVAAAQE